MKTKVVAIAAMFLFPLGAIGQFWLPRAGETAMLAAIMCAIAVTVLRQQSILRRLSRNEKLIIQTQKTAASSKAETALYGKSILRRVKLLADERADVPATNVSTADTDVQGTANQNAGAATSFLEKSADYAGNPAIGRSATPDVSNPFTVETLDSMLAAGRGLKVAGIYSPQLLPDVEQMPWTPGNILSALERNRPEVIVIDEEEFRSSPVWATATGGAGTALMKEILDGIRWARPLQVPIYRLPTTLPPDVHSSMLDLSPATRLPLTTDDLEPAAGAPQTPFLQHLNQLAADRSRGEE